MVSEEASSQQAPCAGTTTTSLGVADAKQSQCEDSGKEVPTAEASTCEEPAAKRRRTEPPRYAEGSAEFVPANDGWWAHKAGEWLYNVQEQTYFHFPTGQLYITTDAGVVPLAVPDGEATTAADEALNKAPAASRTTEATEPPPRFRGRVKWFNSAKGFGFLEPLPKQACSKEDVFVHKNQLREADIIQSGLTPGVIVSYALGETEQGRLCAAEVQVEDEALDGGECDDDAGDDEAAEGGDGDESEGSSVEIDLFEELHAGVHQEKAPSKEAIEDFSSLKVQLPISVLGETATCVFFAVFDGHGGSSCAEYVSVHLAKNILSRLRDRPKNYSDEAALRTALSGGFKQTEHNFLQHARKAGNASGTTACTMTVFGPDEEMRLRLFMANVGDSRAILVKGGGKVVRLTEDHKPNLPAEKKRIEANGGSVIEVAGIWRCLLPQKKWGVSKGLAVSRALGDVEFKMENVISAEPEILIYEVDWDDDEFVILASDGIWDVMSDKDAGLLVQRLLRQGKSSEAAAKVLVERARSKGSQDDCTALVVRFGWNKKTGCKTAEDEEANEDEEETQPMEAAEPASGAAAQTPSAEVAAGMSGQQVAEETKLTESKAAEEAARPSSKDGGSEEEEDEADSDEDDEEVDNIFADGGALPETEEPAEPSKDGPLADDDDDEDEDDEKEKLGARLPLTKPAEDDGVGLFDGLQPPMEELMAPKLPEEPIASGASSSGPDAGKTAEESKADGEAAPSKEDDDEDMDMFAA